MMVHVAALVSTRSVCRMHVRILVHARIKDHAFVEASIRGVVAISIVVLGMMSVLITVVHIAVMISHVVMRMVVVRMMRRVLTIAIVVMMWVRRVV